MVHKTLLVVHSWTAMQRPYDAAEVHEKNDPHET